MDPTSTVLRFKGNTSDDVGMPPDQAREIVAKNAKAAAMRESTTSRTRFIESWLSESPEGIEPTETHNTVEFNIKDLINNGVEPEPTTNPEVKKIELSNSVYYWIESNGDIVLGVELSKNPDNLTVNLTGKNKKLESQPPYADQLYQAILDDSDKPLLFSNVRMSDSGKKIWKKLVGSGKTVSVYDRQNPGQTRQTITDPNELDQFWKLNDPSGQRWQYVLSESGRMTHDVMAAFNTRRARELTGLGTDEPDLRRLIELANAAKRA